MQGFQFTFQNGGEQMGVDNQQMGGNSVRMFRDKSEQVKAIKILHFLVIPPVNTISSEFVLI